jgi:hypothetical protein
MREGDTHYWKKLCIGLSCIVLFPLGRLAVPLKASLEIHFRLKVRFPYSRSWPWGGYQRASHGKIRRATSVAMPQPTKYQTAM